MRPLVFLVANEPQSCRVIRACLERANYRVREYYSHGIAREVEVLRPALVLIEVGPDKDATMELCRSIASSAAEVRSKVILLVGCGATWNRTIVSEAAVDAFVTRPIVPVEFLTQIEDVLRDSQAFPFNEATLMPTELCLGDLQLDPLALRICIKGKPVPITLLEFRLIEFMFRNQGRVFSRDQLLDAVWGEERFVTPRTVDACVRRIRTKIAASQGRASMLKTIRGIGYCLDEVFPSPNDSAASNPRRTSAWPQSRTAETDAWAVGSDA
jgi:DNA-binding response OmpR family regulator